MISRHVLSVCVCLVVSGIVIIYDCDSCPNCCSLFLYYCIIILYTNALYTTFYNDYVEINNNNNNDMRTCKLRYISYNLRSIIIILNYVQCV